MSFLCRRCHKERPGKLGKTISWICECGTDNKLRGTDKFIYSCATCGARNRFWARAQEHADSHGGARIDIELT
ncbi:MAG TPA: hypothetical protein VJQ57_13060 [Acidimicrobiia bacterium]|nr:hypothetical protein [Acidimicrobiia bacterium]